ncbi:hypothetical protein GUJ93_ZPchr0004g39254 [Zizania palustris]|uniref:Uncharacterized protein n=1 Tax=Zizania palustris TaxID=103762 RepID=A0A8J5SZA4_ZIZPA|nr:hypothetical protein GUJ93_ZPchr0004g39254 [Zizania palustris]
MTARRRKKNAYAQFKNFQRRLIKSTAPHRPTPTALSTQDHYRPPVRRPLAGRKNLSRSPVAPVSGGHRVGSSNAAISPPVFAGQSESADGTGGEGY